MATRADKAIIGIVLLISLISYLIFSCAVFGGQAEGVEIFVDGEEYAAYKFAEIDRTKTLKIETRYGYNIIEISDKGVRMTDASCPDKTDIRAGEITEAGQMIVCVPNRVSVRITGKNKLNVDKVTY